MKFIRSMAANMHKKVFGVRCEKRPGIAYLNHTNFKGLNMQAFSFQNRLGNTLRGGIYAYDNPDKPPVVLFFHGMGGGYLAYMAEIEYLCRAGYRVISYDYNGTMTSDGESLEGFCQSLPDAEDAIAAVKALFPQTPLYVMGHSWGGYTAGCMVNLHPEIEKAVLLAPPLSVSHAYLQLVPTKMLAKAMIRMEQEKYPAYWNQSVLGDFQNNENTKVLIIQSTDDKMVNYKTNFASLQQQIDSPRVEFVTVEGKHHNPNYTKEALAYMADYSKQRKKAKTDEELAAMAENVQWHKMCEQDPAVMDRVLAFFDK